MKQLTAGLVIALLSVAGCDNNNDADNVGTTTVVTANGVIIVDESDAIAWESGFFWVAGVQIDPTVVVDVNAVAISGARVIPASFAPLGCATASATGNVVTLQLNSCSGPFELRAVSGTVTFTFTAANPGVGIAVAANNLQVGGGTLTINATGVLTGSGTGRTLTINTNSGGAGPNGTSVARQGQYTLTWNVGDTCANVDGTISGSSANVQSSTFRSFNVCAQGCPHSGTLTVVDPSSGSTLTATFNGTRSVTVTSSTGQQSTATLTCG